MCDNSLFPPLGSPPLCILLLPQAFVLKPQREGGGNNLYGQQAVNAVKSMTAEELHGYILMDMIKAPVTQATLLSTSDAPMVVGVTSELGYFAAYVGSATEVLLNDSTGHVLRSKPATLNEGGVAIGVGSIDSPWLIS